MCIVTKWLKQRSHCFYCTVAQCVIFWVVRLSVHDQLIQFYLLKRCSACSMKYVFSWTVSCWFLQRCHIACNAERCISHGNSVRPSVTRWYPIQTNENRIMRSLLWGSKNSLVLWYQQWLGGDIPFHLKFSLKVTHPLWKALTSTNICL